jgi:hypothetical protein
MTVRTIRKTISFLRPFYLKGVDRLLPSGDYQVMTYIITSKIEYM